MPRMEKVSGIFCRTVWIALPLACFGLWGCEVGPDYKQPDMKPATRFSEIASATRPTTRGTSSSSIRPDYIRWWTTLNDATLNGLIARAARNNPDVLAAEARIREARATRGITASGLFPQIDANGQYDHYRESQHLPGLSALSEGGTVPIPGLEADLWQVGFDMSWEVDVFGGQRRALESATYNVQAAIWDRRDVLVSLLAEVAVNYVELRGSSASWRSRRAI